MAMARIYMNSKIDAAFEDLHRETHSSSSKLNDDFKISMQRQRQANEIFQREKAIAFQTI